MNQEKPKIGINNTSDEWFKIKIDRKKLKELSRRSDYEGWKHISIYFVALLSLGLICLSLWGNWWFFVPVYLAYCTLWGGADAIWHECGHRTAFKTRRLNDFFYQIASFMNNFEAVRFHWTHSLHHSYTASIDPHDFEVDGSIFWKPRTLWEFLLIFVPGFGLLNLHKSLHFEILQHALGVETRVMKECIPEDKKASCIRNSRIYVSLWVAIILLSFGLSSWLPIMLLLVPKFFATLKSSNVYFLFFII